MYLNKTALAFDIEKSLLISFEEMIIIAYHKTATIALQSLGMQNILAPFVYQY